MSFEKARDHLARFGLADRIREFETSSATVELAAQAAGVEPGRIAKSISFKLGERTVLIVAAGDVKVDNAKYREALGGRAKMLTREEAAEPFGVNPGVEVYLDQSLRRFETVLPAAGSANSCVELTLPELERCAGAVRWVDVCRDRA